MQDGGAPYRPRLARMGTLLDDWMARGRGGRGARGRTGVLGDLFPKWLFEDEGRPVLRRCSSTWATWPASLLDEQDDGHTGQVPDSPGGRRGGRLGHGLGGSAYWDWPLDDEDDDPWPPRQRREHRVRWHRDAAPSTAPRDAPRHATRSQDDVRAELRDARRRYFETPARHGHDADLEVDVDDDEDDVGVGGKRFARRPARPATHSRNVPISREVPVDRTTIFRDIPVTREIPVSSEVPADRTKAFRDIRQQAPTRRDDESHHKQGQNGVQDEQPSRPPRTRNIRIELSDSHQDLRASVHLQSASPTPAMGSPPSTRTSTAGKALPRDDSPRTSSSAPSAPSDPRPRQEDAETSSGSWLAERERVLEDERQRCTLLQEENKRLKTVIATIQETNKRWQDFNADRQTYIQRLLSTIEEQQIQLNACLDALKTSTPLAAGPAAPAAAPTPAPAAAATPAAPVAPGGTRTPRTAAQVHELHADAESRLRNLQREVSELQRRLEEAKKEHKETVSMLQCQMDAYRDDIDKQEALDNRQRSETMLRQLAKKLAKDSDTVSPCCSSCRCTCASGCGDQPEEPCSAEATAARSAEPVHAQNQVPAWSGYEVVTDGAKPSPSSPANPADAERARSPSTQYSFCSETLRRQERRAASPALSDALTPTPSSPRGSPPRAPRPAPETPDDGSCYPVELSGSSSSLGSTSGPAPHISVPSSSRATTPDQDVSMCSDATLDCSPPSPVQGTLTVGFTSAGLANVTSFRVLPVVREASESSIRSPSLTPTPTSPAPLHVLARSCSSVSCVSRGPAGDTTTSSAWQEDVWAGTATASTTSSRKNIACPACGRVFPPERQLQFLDHFEACASIGPSKVPPSLSQRRKNVD